MKSSKWQTREGKLKIAAILLWIVAAVQIVAGIAFTVLATEEVDRNLNELLGEKRITIFEVKAAPDEKRMEFDRMKAKAVNMMRLWHGFDIAVGIATGVCAVMVWRQPMRATIGAFVLGFVTTAVKITYQWGLLVPVIFARVLLLWLLLAALVAAVAALKQKPAR